MTLHLRATCTLLFVLPSRWVTVSPGQEECKPCFLGMYCPDEGTSSPQLCPVGTYRDTGYGSSANSCHQCPPHKACPATAADGKAMLDCEGGYYCIFGSSSSTPSKDDPHFDIRKAGPCLPGMYCPKGQIPSPCPRGTLGLAEMQDGISDCCECPAGMLFEPRAADALRRQGLRYRRCCTPYCFGIFKTVCSITNWC